MTNRAHSATRRGAVNSSSSAMPTGSRLIAMKYSHWTNANPSTP